MILKFWHEKILGWCRANCQEVIIRPETWDVFSCEFCEIPKNTFSYRTPLVAASVWCVNFWKNMNERVRPYIEKEGFKYSMLCVAGIFCWKWILFFNKFLAIFLFHTPWKHQKTFNISYSMTRSRTCFQGAWNRNIGHKLVKVLIPIQIPVLS